VRVHNQGEGAAKGGAATFKASPQATSEPMTMSFAASDTQEIASSTEGTSTTRKAVNPRVNADAGQRKAALQLQLRAQSKLVDAQETFGDLERYLLATTSAKVEVQLTELERNLDIGKQKIKSNDFDGARSIFADVLRGSVELNALLRLAKPTNVILYDHLFGTGVPTKTAR